MSTADRTRLVQPPTSTISGPVPYIEPPNQGTNRAVLDKPNDSMTGLLPHLIFAEPTPAARIC